MLKTVINNRAEPEWTPVIEARLQIMLGSLLNQVTRIEVDFEHYVEKPAGQAMYSCKLCLTESSGQKYRIFNNQTDAKIAIEGALARARRMITRLSRDRSKTWGVA